MSCTLRRWAVIKHIWMIWQQSKSISMHALMELWWQLAVTLNSELNVTKGVQRAFLCKLGLLWKELTLIQGISYLDWCETCWFGELESSFSRELHWWHRVWTADDSVHRGVDNSGRVCTACFVTEMCATHNCAGTGLVGPADMEQNPFLLTGIWSYTSTITTRGNFRPVFWQSRGCRPLWNIAVGNQMWG